MSRDRQRHLRWCVPAAAATERWSPVNSHYIITEHISCPIQTKFNTALPWALTNTNTKWESDKPDGSRDMRATCRQTEICGISRWIMNNCWYRSNNNLCPDLQTDPVRLWFIEILLLVWSNLIFSLGFHNGAVDLGIYSTICFHLLLSVTAKQHFLAFLFTRYLKYLAVVVCNHLFIFLLVLKPMHVCLALLPPPPPDWICIHLHQM